MRSGIFLILLIAATATGCNTCDYNVSTAPSYDELPGPPINTFQYTESNDIPEGRGRGTVDIKLGPEQLSTIFYNDKQAKQDEWGTIKLVSVSDCCKATINFSGQTLTTRPGKVFPGTGLYLVNTYPNEMSVWIRSRWTHTVVQTPERN